MSMAATEIPMPRVSEEVNEYTLTAWLKNAGSQVEVGEVIAEVMTDKANVEIESPVAGVLDEILVAEEDNVVVGQVIACVKATAT